MENGKKKIRKCLGLLSPVEVWAGLVAVGVGEGGVFETI